MNYVYIQSEPNLWTVGFYDPTGKWHAEKDCDTQEEAASRVHWLNGGEVAHDTFCLDGKYQVYRKEFPR